MIFIMFQENLAGVLGIEQESLRWHPAQVEHSSSHADFPLKVRNVFTPTYPNAEATII